MGVYVELRGHIECDRCGESYETLGYTVAKLKKEYATQSQMGIWQGDALSNMRI